MSQQSYSKMYGTEHRYKDLGYNNIPDITIRIKQTERKIFPDIMILSEHSQNIELSTITVQFSSDL